MDNSTLNIINVEIAIIKDRQTRNDLSILDLKKLESLINMKKTLVSTPEIKNESEVDESLFTDEEVFDFLKARIAKANEIIAIAKAKEKKKAKKT